MIRGLNIILFNGFCLGLERVKNKPIWMPLEDTEDTWEVSYVTGFAVHLGFVRITYGDYVTLDDINAYLDEQEEEP